MENVVTSTNTKSGFFISLIKGAFVAILISLVGILLFALFIKFVDISDSWIMPINQVIKLISILFGVKIFLKGSSGFGLFKGALLGIIYTIFAFIIFSILSSSFSIDFTLLYDVLFGCIMGAICGVICISVTK